MIHVDESLRQSTLENRSADKKQMFLGINWEIGIKWEIGIDVYTLLYIKVNE